MLQIRSEQIQAIRQELNLSFRSEIIGLLEENGYEAILNQDTNDIGIKDKSGNTAWLRYNQQVLPATFELPSGTAYHLNYYSDGGLQSVQMPNGNAIELFTKDGKLISLNHKGGASVSLSYTKDHQVKEIKVSKKKKYEFKYDKTYGYLNAIIDGNKQTKFFNHDNSGNLRQKIDAEGRTTYFHYEVGENDLQYIQYPDGSRETYKYNEDNNSLEITQRNNAWVKNYYDDNDNLRQVEWQDGSFILLEYDEEEEISSIQNEQSLINFRKDSNGEIIEEEGEFGSIKYEYNAEEQLSKVIYPDKYEIKYSYDIDSELAEVKDSEWNVFKFTKDAKSSTSKISFGNAEYATREHFNGQIAETSLNTQNGNSYGQLYEYDDQERLSKISDTRSKFPSRTLHYDDADHLLAVKTDKEKVVEQFTYDRSGNLNSANSKNVVIGAMEETKVYGENVLGYDSNGHLTDFLGAKATFKQNNTLDTIEAKGQKWSYQYDAFGRRISKSNGRETTQYIWAGIQLYEEIHIANGVETRQKYLYRPFEQRPFAIKTEKGVYLLQEDQRGAVIRAVDSFGDLVWEAEYDAFGKAYIRTEKIHQPWRLQGQYFDAESDLHYNLGRYYSPILKTYLSRDPRWYEVDASNYNYANNDPYNKADSQGAWLHIVAGAVIGAVVGGTLAYATGGDWRAGALGGAVTGALTAAFPAGEVLFEGIGSAVETAADNYLNGKNESVACAFLEGLVFGKIFKKFGKLLGENAFVKNVFNKVKTKIDDFASKLKSEFDIIPAKPSTELGITPNSKADVSAPKPEADVTPPKPKTDVGEKPSKKKKNPSASKPNPPKKNTRKKKVPEKRKNKPQYDENGQLKPNTKYKAGEYDYNYETDELGRIKSVETDNLQLTKRDDRLRHESKTPGKEKGDHAGHLIGDRFGGSADIDNLVSQSSKVNLSDFRVIENQWAEALNATPPKKVKTKITPSYEGNSTRPSSIKVEWEIDGEHFKEIINNI